MIERTPLVPNPWPNSTERPHHVDYGKVDYDLNPGDSDTTAITTRVLAEHDGPSDLADTVIVEIDAHAVETVRVIIDGDEWAPTPAEDEGPELNTLDRAVWRGQKLINLGADKFEVNGDDPEDLTDGFTTQLGDVFADLIHWGITHEVNIEYAFAKAEGYVNGERREAGAAESGR